MMRWSSILAMYSKPMAECEFAAFLIRRYTFLSSLVNCKYASSFNNHLIAELNICSGFIDKITDKDITEVLLELNKPKIN